MNTTLTKLSAIKRNPNNPRVLQDEKLDKLVRSITDFPQMLEIRPIVVNNDMMVLGGNMRLKACKEAGLKEVPVMKASDLTEEQQREFIIKDNVGFGEWNWELLQDEWDWELLDEWGLELEFDAVDDNEGLTDEDDVPEIQEEHISKLGDIWLLGEHRVMCGDSTSSDDVEKLMNGEKADMVFTSPPYNANTKSGQGDIFNRKKSVKLYSDGYSDNLNSSDYVDFSKSVLNNCFLYTDGFIFWNVSYNANSRFEYIEQIQKHLQFLIEQICWKKSSTIPFKGSLMRDWEPIYVFSTNGNMLGLDSVNSNYWEVNNTNSQQDNHKACFPIELPFKAINLKKQFKLILEPFLGSGSTLIAAEKLNRKCYGMELDEKYCDVIIERWEQFTGQKAEKIK